jgi:hypothetical protein
MTQAQVRDKPTVMRAGELVEDFAIYPRNDIDDYYVGQLAEAIRAGAVLPPVVADRASKRIVDGFNRRRALLRVEGADAQIAVMLHRYPDEAAMVADAMRLNSMHGRRLAAFDQIRCISLAERFGISRDDLPGLLNITKVRLEKLSDRRTLDGSPLKLTMSHLSGAILTPAQQEFNRKAAGGKSGAWYLRQVIALLEADALDRSDEQVTAALDRLRALLCQAEEEP